MFCTTVCRGYLFLGPEPALWALQERRNDKCAFGLKALTSPQFVSVAAFRHISLLSQCVCQAARPPFRCECSGCAYSFSFPSERAARGRPMRDELREEL